MQTRKLVSTTDLQQSHLLNDTNSAVKNQLATTIKAKEDAEHMLVELQEEERLALHAKDQIEREIHAKNAPIISVNKWLSVRAQRPEQMRLTDQVESCLKKLLSELKFSVQKLEEMKEKQIYHLKQLEAARAALVAEIADKSRAANVDRGTLATSHSPGGTIFLAQQPHLNPMSWTGSASAIVARARSEVDQSARHRQSSAQFAAERLAAEKADHAKLLAERQTNVDKIKQEMAEYDARISSHIASRRDLCAREHECLESRDQKLAGAQVASQRMLLRTQRPSREQVYDGTQKALRQEFDSMNSSAAQLKNAADWSQTTENAEAGVQANLQDLFDKKYKCFELDEFCLTVDIPLLM